MMPKETSEILMPVEKSLEDALKHQQTGNLVQAAAIYLEILKTQPDNIDALHLLGLVAYKTHKNDLALELIGKAIALNPSVPDFHNNYGLIWEAKNNIEKAIVCYEKAIQLKPDYSRAYTNLGNIFKTQKKTAEAISYYQKTIQLQPSNPTGHYNLGIIFQENKKLEEALRCYQKAIELNPSYEDAHYNMGNLFHEQDKFSEAAACYRRSIELNASNFDAHYNLGVVLHSAGKFSEAFSSYQSALQLSQNSSKVYCSLGKFYYDQNQLSEAIDCFKKAIQIDPNYHDAHRSLGFLLRQQGKISEAILSFKKAHELKPECIDTYSSLLFSYNLSPAPDPIMICKEHQRWAKQYANHLKIPTKSHTNTRDPNRRLQIGYVSPDFKQHSVAIFIEPILRSHNRDQVEVTCYSNNKHPDVITKHLQTLADRWRPIAHLADEAANDLIENDKIDILIDLAGHTANNRLLLFARKPAPVQVTYLGYSTTTGLEAIDYRISDSYADPPGKTDQYYTEKLIHLDCTWCYQPMQEAPAVGPLPCLESTPFTFASLNTISKMGPEVVSLWSKILNSVPGSRIMLFKEDNPKNTYKLFAQHGITDQQLILVQKRSRFEYLKLHQQIDLGLDPFPCNGGTTTCESLWMGVPVVSLAGNTFVSRAGVSLLTNLGLTTLIAETSDQYIEIAVKLARDKNPLIQLRQELRNRMKQSPIVDSAQFIHQLESAYRRIWGKWCLEQK